MDVALTLLAFWFGGILYGWCAHALYKSTKELSDEKAEMESEDDNT